MTTPFFPFKSFADALLPRFRSERPYGYTYRPEDACLPPIELLLRHPDSRHVRWGGAPPPEWRESMRSGQAHSEGGRTFPSAGTYRLKKELTVPRGWAYVREVGSREMQEMQEKFRWLSLPPQLHGSLDADGRLAYDVPGMLEAVPGVPYRTCYPDKVDPRSSIVPIETRFCVHTLDTLREYPNGESVRLWCSDMLASCFGEVGQLPIWHHLKRNNRSTSQRSVRPGDPGFWDGTYSLALTLGEGQGRGTVQVASQPAVSSDRRVESRVRRILTACADVATFALRSTVSDAEWTALSHLKDVNNLHGFGGSLFTGLQLNVSSGSFGTLRDSLGYQGGLHVDRKDDPAGYTVFVFCVQHSSGEPSFVPSPDFLACDRPRSQPAGSTGVHSRSPRRASSRPSRTTHWPWSS